MHLKALSPCEPHQTIAYLPPKGRPQAETANPNKQTRIACDTRHETLAGDSDRAKRESFKEKPPIAERPDMVGLRCTSLRIQLKAIRIDRSACVTLRSQPVTPDRGGELQIKSRPHSKAAITERGGHQICHLATYHNARAMTRRLNWRAYQNPSCSGERK